MGLPDTLTWFRLGRPKAGEVTINKRNSYLFEQGVEVPKRLEAAFGPLHVVSAADLGCGPGESAVASQILAVPWKRLVSVEAFLPYIHKLQTHDVAAEKHEIFTGHIEHFFRESKPRELDVALLIDVLEHFPRRDALHLLRLVEAYFTRGAAIFLPLGRVVQEPYDQNALQRHRSHWEAEELSKLGYKVTVYQGLHGQLAPPADAAWAIKRWR